MQEKFEEHLKGYEERRIQTDKFHKDNTKRLDGITKSLEDQDKVLDEIKTNTDQHFDDDAEFQKKTNKALQDLGELVPIVKEQLLPAYVKEMDRQRAYQIIKEDRDKLGEWGKFVLIVGSIITMAGGALAAYIKFYK